MSLLVFSTYHHIHGMVKMIPIQNSHYYIRKLTQQLLKCQFRSADLQNIFSSNKQKNITGNVHYERFNDWQTVFCWEISKFLNSDNSWYITYWIIQSIWAWLTHTNRLICYVIHNIERQCSGRTYRKFLIKITQPRFSECTANAHCTASHVCGTCFKDNASK